MSDLPKSDPDPPEMDTKSGESSSADATVCVEPATDPVTDAATEPIAMASQTTIQQDLGEHREAQPSAQITSGQVESTVASDDTYDDTPDSDTETVRTISSKASFRSATSYLEPRNHLKDNEEAATPVIVGPTRPDVDTSRRVEEDIKDSDLVGEIRGMYRILDLISEQGSGGLGMS
ncbi:hypothetical protein EUX98_g5384 [Antrodiella citrinella]|uniref:Uncharacterized protein n=1 Tax=Antrodiella citrinella TaxID=2447956 RepID=A0A4S4MZE6_9APHY|nr:hypothetical protein EUX98_g5384 [Antrodiella citrinella]